jgi:hypothetical protein
MDMPGHVAEADANPLLLACVEACDDCQRTLRDAVRGGADGASTRAVRRLLLDCAEICEATANYACAGSVFLPEMVAACVRLCDECGAACEAVPDDAAMDACAEACRRCARACFAPTARLGRRSGAARQPVA